MLTVISPLSCPIKPGAVKERYHFQWKALNLHSYGDNLLLDDTSHSIHTNISHSVQYQCTATVIHSEGQKYTYDGPVIHIHSHGEVCSLSNAHFHYGNTSKAMNLLICVWPCCQHMNKI